MTPISVLIADDYAPFRVMLRHLVDAQPDMHVVGEAGDGALAVELAASLEPDVVMLDLAMPRLDGWEAIPLMRAASPRSRIVVLTGFTEEHQGEAAQRAGVARYLEKGEPQESITAAVREAAGLAPETVRAEGRG